MNWQKIKCAVLGHQWHVGAGDCVSDIMVERNCACGARIPAIVWPRAPMSMHELMMPQPTRSAPPMPACKPPKTDGDWRERAEVIEILDAIERLTDRVDRLEASRQGRILFARETTYGDKPSSEIIPLTELQRKPITGRSVTVGDSNGAVQSS